MQHQITRPSRLLTKDSTLKQVGYGSSPLLTYRRKDVVKKHRIKEWDSYFIYNTSHGVSLTIAKSLNLLSISISLFNFKDKNEYHKNIRKSLTEHSFYMPQSSIKGNILFEDDTLYLSIRIEGRKRTLFLTKKDLHGKVEIEMSLLLYNEPTDSLVVSSPFPEDPQYFLYCRMIPGIQASGYIRIKETTYLFSPFTSLGLLDWARGVFPYHTTWQWIVAQGFQEYSILCFNFGSSNLDTTIANNNGFFYNGTLFKFDQIQITQAMIDDSSSDTAATWLITSEDQSLSLTFEAIYESISRHHVLLVSYYQKQIFGYFTGKITLGNEVLSIQPLLGMIEVADCKW